ncbi:hypothetical protein [Kocuria dechangensis]|nr:hypothetical protein [Kocuria dechangensis]
MPRQNTRGHTRTDASGPVVAVCHGHRCAGLRRLHGTADHADRIREAVKATPGAVLITSPCLGRCEMASLAAVARRDGPSGRVGPTVWLSGLEDECRAEALTAWIASGGPQRLHQPDHGLPRSLGAAVSGYGPPPAITGHGR